MKPDKRILPEPFPVAVRVYAAVGARRTSGSRRRLKPWPWTLTFDTETTIGPEQRLRFGCYQVRRAGRLKEAGLFYDPTAVTDRERRTVASYAKKKGWRVRTLPDFIEHVFFHLLCRQNGTCIGFNLPFDLSRLAIDHALARRSMRGGFSFRVTPDRWRPRVVIRHLNSRAAIIGLSIPAGRNPEHRNHERGGRVPAHRGHFVDVRTLGAALTGASHSLASLARLLSTKNRKLEGEMHGLAITTDYLDYCMQDVQATWECFEKLTARLEAYALTQTPVTSIFSEASMGKALLREMGVAGWTELESGFPPGQLGTILATYYGARCEVRIRHKITRVLYVDFLSMYPTDSRLTGLWQTVTAESLSSRDVTAEARLLLERITLADLRDPKAWTKLGVLVKVQPQGDILPVRCTYGGEGRYGLGMSRLTSEKPMWYTLADCIAGRLLTGKVPEVLEALAFEPTGIQGSLSAYRFFGDEAQLFDPASDDLYERLIEQRQRLQAERDRARADGDKAAAEALDAEQQGLKIMANALYGISLETRVNKETRPRGLTCYDANGEGFETKVQQIELPGPYFHPLVATLVTGAARLMLAIAERLARDEGITWALCDTDSMALARPEGMGEEEFLRRAKRVTGWFDRLNPYPSGGPLLKIEDANFALDKGRLTERVEPLYCLAVSSKRYVLFNLDDQGRPVIRRASAHHLGQYLSPYEEGEAPESIPDPAVPLAELGVKRWQYDLWYRVVEAFLSGTEPQFDDLPGFDRPALSRYSVTTPVILSWFGRYNEGRRYVDQIRPFGLLLSAHPDTSRPLPLGADPKHFRLVAPFCTDSRQWRKLRFVETNTGDAYTISTATSGQGLVQVRSYAQMARQYAVHPETKALDAGGKPCQRGTVGELERRHIEICHVEFIGKEANRAEEARAGLIRDADELYVKYEHTKHSRFEALLRPALRLTSTAEIARLAGVAQSTVRKATHGRSVPRPEVQAKLEQALAAYARAYLAAHGMQVPRQDAGGIFLFLKDQSSKGGGRACSLCGKKLSDRRAQYCSNRCRQKAYRKRHGKTAGSPKGKPSPLRKGSLGRS